MEKRIARTFVALTTLHHLASGWFAATYVLFLLDQDLTLFHANLLNVAFMSANVLLDPLTGNLADKIGQRRVHIIGEFFWGLGMLVYASGNSFGVFLLAELIAAAGNSLISGALDSWAHNNLGEATTHKAISQAGALAMLAGIPPAIAGSVVGSTFGFRLPWLLAGLTAMVVTAVAYLMLKPLPEGQHQHPHSKGKPPGVMEVIELTLWSRQLRFTVIVTLVSAIAFQPFNMFWSPVMRDASGQAWWLGLVWAGIAVTAAVGSQLAGSRRMPLNGIGVATVLLTTGLPMLVTPLLHNQLVLLVAAFLAHEVGRGALRPVLFTYANRHIEDHYRSTANSVRSASMTMGAAIGLAVSGALTLWFAPTVIWGMSAGILILLALWALLQKD